MNKRNYQKELEQILEKIKRGDCDGQEKQLQSAETQRQKTPPRLFLHSCCAPCSSYVLEYLSRYFAITVFYYNPNISMQDEYRLRVEEQKRLITAFNEEAAEGRYLIRIQEGDYVPECFFETVKGLEQCPEGGERCFRCFDLRLRETAKQAAEGGYDYFCTTLTISPLKNAQKLNEIGEALTEEYKVPWLPSDFKKKNGYKRSVELSAEYELYRQNYCGCVFSKMAAQAQKQEK